MHFQREMLRCRDGGEVALDWICLERAGPPAADYEGVIVLQLPGIVGKASNRRPESYRPETPISQGPAAGTTCVSPNILVGPVW